MIIEQPVIRLLRVDTADESGAWIPWAAQLRTLSLTRGGSRSGVRTTVEPAMLSGTLVDAGDPLRDPRLRPNAPVRICTPYDSIADFDAIWAGKTIADFNAAHAGKTFADFNADWISPTIIFTGTLTDISTTYSFDKATGDRHTFVTFTATDAVASHAATTRYGAVVEGGIGFESWADRIIRLAESSHTEIDPPADDSPIVRYRLG